MDVWQAKVPTAPDETANPVTLGRLATLTGGRLPVGLSANVTPGPFQAEWSANTEYNVLAAGEALISADAETTRIVTLQGGGLTTAKTVSAGSLGSDWSISEQETSAAARRSPTPPSTGPSARSGGSGCPPYSFSPPSRWRPSRSRAAAPPRKRREEETAVC